MRAYACALAVLTAVPFYVGCDCEGFVGDSDRFREDFQYSYDLQPGGRISVDTFNGSVEILSWEKDAVQISGAKYAARQSDLQNIRIDTKADGNSVTVRTLRPDMRRGNMGARFFLRVPRKVALDLIHSSNGTIRVEEIEGSMRLETSNGAIRLRKINGHVDARTSNGSIEGTDLDGGAVLKTSNGPVRIDRLRGSMEAVTSNGGIHFTMAKPRAGETLHFGTSNGPIDLQFDELSNNEIRASTSNSSITLRAPSSTKAELRASTSNSSITSDFDVTTRGSLSKNRLEGSINGGGPLIQLGTSNGHIRLSKL